ncbi:MAG: DUF4337 domain-containing protein [Burkholderiales bacterium]
MSGHGHVDPSNKRIAMLISVLALVLAISETLGKGAQTTVLNVNIEAANLWNFFQAKTIRGTVLKTAAEEMEVDLPRVTDPKAKEVMEKRIAEWKKNEARYQSEPETGEGRKELMARAIAAEKKRDVSLAAYHNFEIASAAVQIAIVLASAQVITGVVALVWISAGLGLIGLAFCTIGIFWPTAVHLF